MRKLAVMSVLMLAACSTREAPPAAVPVTVPPPTLWKPSPELMSFTVLGTEPFWSITTSQTEVVYSTPELPQGVRLIAGSGYYRDPAGQEQISFTAKLNGEALVLIIERGQCSDGMSDTVYPYTAKLRIGVRTEQGCARRN